MPIDGPSVVAAAAAAGNDNTANRMPAMPGPVVGGGQHTAAQNSAAAANGAAAAYPDSFMSVMKAMQQGELPPGIQQVDDRLSVDAASPSTPSVAQPPKPWQQKMPQ
jgi:hypothetical protein